MHGDLLIVRPPVPATCNKAGANYKSEVTHLRYAPRQAFDEWIAICEAITQCGGDALFDFETLDEPFLDCPELRVSADGAIFPCDSTASVGHIDNVMTGRVFAANGPWVLVGTQALRALMPNMLTHRLAEAPYYEALLSNLASECGLHARFEHNPHRWEGMADIAALDDVVVLTYAVAGHYDQNLSPKSARSSREGVAHAADFANIPESARLFVELVYPHFHGDTVHFSVRTDERAARLVQYPGGLWGSGASELSNALGASRIVGIDRTDAVDHYAANSRQVRQGLLVPDGVSDDFTRTVREMGLAPHLVPLSELFGKAGGGPACATLYLPRNLKLPASSPLRYSNRRQEVQARRERTPSLLTVDAQYFANKQRG